MNKKSGCLPLKQMYRQFLLYVIVGASVNLCIYAFYVVFTYFWGFPKLTMTILYIVGASIGFFANRFFTFQYKGQIIQAGARYMLAQFLGYLLNLGLLLFFVDWFGFPHQVIQAIAIVIVAIFLFILSQFFIFPQRLVIPRGLGS